MTVPTVQSKPDPSLREAAEVAAELGTDLRARAHAVRRRRRGSSASGPNRLESAEAVPAWRRFLAPVRRPADLPAARRGRRSRSSPGRVEGADGVPYDAVVIAAIVVLNAVLGFVQEVRAEQAVAALQRMTAPTATVVRDGREQRIAAAEIVPGDVLLLAEGDAVSADARLARGRLPLGRRGGADRRERAGAQGRRAARRARGPGRPAEHGLLRHRGHARPRPRRRDRDRHAAPRWAHVARLLGRTEKESTPLQHEVDRIGRMLGVAVIAIVVVVVATILLTADIQTSSDVVDVLLVGVSLAVAAVPEGLPAILSVVLALGVQRMARQRAIVKKLSSVETLGSASVICSDKTGTLTKNEMTIEKVLTALGRGRRHRQRLPSRRASCCVDGRPLDDPVALDEVRAVLVAAAASPTTPSCDEEGGEWTIQGDPTDAAFLVAEAKVAGLTAESRRRASSASASFRSPPSGS